MASISLFFLSMSASALAFAFFCCRYVHYHNRTRKSRLLR